MYRSMRFVIILAWLSGHACAQDDSHGSPATGPKLLRGASDVNATSSDVLPKKDERSLSAPARGCQSRADFTGEKDCGGAIVGSLAGLVGILTKGFFGGWEDGDGKALVLASVDVVQGFVEAVIPFPVTMISQILFPMLKSFLGVALDAPSTDTPLGYVSFKQLFRRRARSNQVRMDALQGEMDWFSGLFLKNETLIKRSPVYEAAGLSQLLNLQHDLALDQDLFFGAECLLTADESNFAQISAGQCGEQTEADMPILDKLLCKQAARALGLADDVVKETQGADKPYGCYFKYGDHTGLYFNTETGTASRSATSDRRALCAASSMSSQIGKECRAWQRAGTWELAAMYAITNLGVLVDIARHYPDLEKTSRERAQKLTAKYQKLLKSSFSEYSDHRTSLLKKPEVYNTVLCWHGKYVTEGRDYFYQRNIPGDVDGKCRGACDVMSSFCNVRPERGNSKYCVEDENKWKDAEACFQRYVTAEIGGQTSTFDNLMGQLTVLREKVTNS